MVVWRITGNEIGEHGNGARFFALRRDADVARREYMSDEGNGAGNVIDPPQRIVVKSREDLVRQLTDAMGYGAS